MYNSGALPESPAETTVVSMSAVNVQAASGRPRSSARTAKRRWLQYLLLFSTVALVVNALIGDRGLTALVKVKRDYAQLRWSLERSRHENAALREEVKRLSSDPKTIEEVARRELGLARKDELLFIVKDVPSRP
jgi:cell division protein FtsB